MGCGEYSFISSFSHKVTRPLFKGSIFHPPQTIISFIKHKHKDFDGCTQLHFTKPRGKERTENVRRALEGTQVHSWFLRKIKKRT